MTPLPESLLESVAAAAVREGLADAVFTRLSTPIGRLLVVQGAEGIVRIGFEEEAEDRAAGRGRRGARPAHRRPPTASWRPTRDALSAYLEGDATSLDAAGRPAAGARAVPARRARDAAREVAARRDRHLRRAGRAQPATRRPRARSARPARAIRSRSSCPATACCPSTRRLGNYGGGAGAQARAARARGRPTLHGVNEEDLHERVAALDPRPEGPTAHGRRLLGAAPRAGGRPAAAGRRPTARRACAASAGTSASPRPTCRRRPRWPPPGTRRAIERLGRLLAAECRRKGVDVLLAPTVNLHRTPYGGRHFECFSEDPLLTARIGAAYVRGLQARGRRAPRSSTSSPTTPRPSASRSTRRGRAGAARALPGAVRGRSSARRDPWAVMAAYNGVNGAHDDRVARCCATSSRASGAGTASS